MSSTFALFSCGSNSLNDHCSVAIDADWHREDSLECSFTVDRAAKYLFLPVLFTEEFPNRNIILWTTLIKGNDTLIHEASNFDLMDVYGNWSVNNGSFEHLTPLLLDSNLVAGDYRLKVAQYMRYDKLQGVKSITVATR